MVLINNMSLRNKNDIILNPKTRRPIKVGGRIYNALVKEGYFKGESEFRDDNILYNLNPSDNVEDVINNLNKNLPKNISACRGRGKYKNSIVKRNKQMPQVETQKHTLKQTAKTLKNRKVYNDLQNTDDFERSLEELIMSELAGLTVKKPKRSPQRSPQQSPERSESVDDEDEDEVEYEDEDDDEDEDEDEDYDEDDLEDEYY